MLAEVLSAHHQGFKMGRPVYLLGGVFTFNPLLLKSDTGITPLRT